MVTFASLALQGYVGTRSLSWPLRPLLVACAVAVVSPRLEVTLGATLLGAVTLAFGYLRGRPAKVDVAA
jgi:hypothetical protein